MRGGKVARVNVRDGDVHGRATNRAILPVLWRTPVDRTSEAPCADASRRGDASVPDGTTDRVTVSPSQVGSDVALGHGGSLMCPRGSGNMRPVRRSRHR